MRTRAQCGAHAIVGYLYQLLAMTGWTSLPWLWSLPQPTLILMGSDDPLVPPINGHILARLIPNAELRMIDDGHLFMVTRPAETAGFIEEFLAAERKRTCAEIQSVFADGLIIAPAIGARLAPAGLGRLARSLEAAPPAGPV